MDARIGHPFLEDVERSHLDAHLPEAVDDKTKGMTVPRLAPNFLPVIHHRQETCFGVEWSGVDYNRRKSCVKEKSLSSAVAGCASDRRRKEQGPWSCGPIMR
jgi:hypothetical protein